MKMDAFERRKLSLEKLAKLQRELPAGWKFDREAANDRNEDKATVVPSPELANPLHHN